ncbi:MAG TPA: DUF3501 family protein [Acidimicrobiales bacterium]|nr:DUF3501 family protein [Acidimicrobiales bacterium]
MTKLTLDDISDLRAYERERGEFRARVIELKKRRRVHVGPIVTFVFENRDTIRFQIQEMARVEKLISDEAIETELDVYNPLIPEPGSLSATMFIELTSDDALRDWLPRLVGIEQQIELHIGSGADTQVVRCVVDPEHARQLTRDETTASVHYVHWDLTPDEVEAFASGPVALAVTHPEYEHATDLGDDTRAELLADLRG